MSTEEIITQLSQQYDSQAVIYQITMQNLIAEIVRRMGANAITLTAEDLQNAKEEVLAALEHYAGDSLSIGLDTWEITHQL